MGLKERLEKKELKQLILNIKCYKEKGQVQPLISQLKEFLDKKAVSQGDIIAFKPFIRDEDKSVLESLITQ